MRYNTLLLVAAATLAVADIEPGDYPSYCSSVCAPVASRSSYCDQTNDDDAAEQCTCNGPNMRQQIPRCNACVAAFRQNAYDYDDILQLLNYCGFPTQAAETVTVTSVSFRSSVYTTTVTSTDDDGDLDIDVDVTTSTIGLVPIVTTVTTTETDDDGDIDIDTVTSTISISTRPNAGVTVTRTLSGYEGSGSNDGGSQQTGSAAGPGSAPGAASSSAASTGSAAGSGNNAVATAVPVIGAGVAAIIAGIVAL